MASKFQVKRNLLAFIRAETRASRKTVTEMALDRAIGGAHGAPDRGITILHPTSWGRAWHVAKQHPSIPRCLYARRSDGTSIRDAGWPG